MIRNYITKEESKKKSPFYYTYFRAIGYAPGAEFVVSARRDRETIVFFGKLGDDDISELRESRNGGRGKDGVTNWIPSRRVTFDRLQQLARDGFNVFSHPNHLKGGLGNKHAQGFTALFCEWDDLPLDDQRARITEIESQLGLTPAAVVFSGSKSLHTYYRISDECDAGTWQRLNRKLAIVANSDPAICSLARAMRLPGVLRIKNGTAREVSLEGTSDCAYTVAELERTLDGTGMFPHGLSDERWRQWRRNRTDAVTAREILTKPEGDLVPKFEPVDVSSFSYSGDTVPLDICLTRMDNDAIAGGGQQGERNNTGFTLARNLTATARFLDAEGIRYSPQPRALFDSYCMVSGLDGRESEAIWRSASRGTPTPSRPTDSILASIQWWQRRQQGGVGFGESNRKSRPRTISRKQWQEKFGRDRETGALVSFLGHQYRRAKRSLERTQPEPIAPSSTEIEANETETAIAPYNRANDGKLTLDYKRGELPTWDEWKALGRPTIEYGDGERLQCWLEMLDKGYPYPLDSSVMGSGKSHAVAQLALTWLRRFEDEEGEDAPRAFYLADDHRNPTVATIERHATDLVSRHDGLAVDRTRQTALGRHHVVRPRNGQTPEIQGNCPETQTFLQLAAKGYPVRGGKDSPICERCPLFQNGCEFLGDRQRQLQNDRFLRAHLDQATGRSQDIAVIDEAGKSIDGTHAQTVTLEDISKEAMTLSLEHGSLYAQIYPVVAAIWETLKSETENGKKFYGVSHAALLDKLPTRDELEAKLWEHQADAWLNADDCWQLPSVDTVAGQIDDAMAQRLSGLFSDEMTPAEKQSQIDRNISPNWIGRVLNVILGNDSRTDIAINRNRELVLTQRARRHGRTIKKFGAALLLDATANRLDLARRIGVEFDAIVPVRQRHPHFGNLRVNLVRGVGAAGTQRRDDSPYAAQNRILEGIKGIVAKHPQAKSLGLVDYKNSLHYYDGLSVDGVEIQILPGHWFHDNRGSNAFKDCDVLIAVGTPTPNLGQMAADWHSLTGEVVKPDTYTGRYGAWVRDKAISEVLQLVGRTRAQHSPATAKHVYLLSDGVASQPFVDRIGATFPGAVVCTTEAYDLAPQAATKGEQTARGIVEGVWRAIADGGDITAKAIAAQLGQSASNVTQTLKTATGRGFKWLKQNLVLLYRALNNKTQFSNLDIPEDIRWVAEHYLGVLLESPAEKTAEELENLWQSFGAATFQQILAAAPVYVITGLIAKLLQLPVAGKVRSHLRESIPIAA